MTLHHPRKPIKPKFPWSAGDRRREEQKAPSPLKVKDTWQRIPHTALEGIRLLLGLSEIEMSRLLGIEKNAYLALQRGPGAIIGPAVKLLALLRSVPAETRGQMIAFLVSPAMPTLPPM
jgi:hypothetical protein